jgi:hypothetical protein
MVDKARFCSKEKCFERRDKERIRDGIRLTIESVVQLG